MREERPASAVISLVVESSSRAASSYAERVNVVMDYVRQHLDRNLTLAELARVASFSPYHFHRIFKGQTGETIASFTRRARLERAVALMRSTPTRDLGSVGVEVGFATPSEFSRVFRSVYGRSPSTWDRRSRLDGAVDLTDEVAAEEAGISWPDGSGPKARLMARPACRVAYLRVRDPWQDDRLTEGYDQLLTWVRQRMIEPTDQQLLGLSWESGKVTPLDLLVYDLGITVPEDVTAEGTIGVHHLPAALAVEVHCTSLRSTAIAWEFLYGEWLPKSGYEPLDRPAVKWFRRAPDRLDSAAWDVDCSIAVRKGYV